MSDDKFAWSEGDIIIKLNNKDGDSIPVHKNDDVEKSDESLVEDFAEEEGSGIKDYTKALDEIKDPDLRKIIEGILAQENVHYKKLEDWLDEHESGESDEEEVDEDDESVEKSDATLEHYREFHNRVMADPRFSKYLKDEHKKGSMGPAISAGKKRAKDALMNELPVVPGEEEFKEEDPEEYEDGLEETEELDDKKIKKSYEVPILKFSDDEMKMWGQILIPAPYVDLQGDSIEPEEIVKAAHGFLENARKFTRQHKNEVSASVVESYIAPTDFDMNGQTVVKGTWVAAVHVTDPSIWAEIKAGTLNAFSIGGHGIREPID